MTPSKSPNIIIFLPEVVFLEYLNSQHSNIKFTFEAENNSKLPFLDVLISRNHCKAVTSVYRKPTFTGLGINYLSFIPKLFKINAVKTLLYRCYHISSNWNAFHEEIQFLKDFFMNNNYPLSIVENCISSFLNNLFEPCRNINEAKTEAHYFRLPYYGYLSFIICKKLDQAFKLNYPDIKV